MAELFQGSRESMIQQAVHRLDVVTGPSDRGHEEADEVLVKYLKSISHARVAHAWEQARDRVEFWYD